MKQSKGELAKEYFQSGANCAQAVLAAYHEECGLDEKTAFRLASGFGAGMGRMREVCGAVSGMILAANILRGADDITDKNQKDAHYAFIQVLMKEFQQEAGSLICRDLLGLTTTGGSAPTSEARTREYYAKRPCGDMVKLAAEILERHLQD
jgi:C_GCAxxG_C_C family probable redox protein